MAARKLQQEVDKCFKKVAEGMADFDAIYEKIEQSTNPAQKEKLEDQLKREIKKLQRLRDQIKTWATGNDIKDKAPLLEQRKLIETKMESFKAVEKAMKTKAYSKEGLSAQQKLDPKEQAKLDTSEWLAGQVEDLEQQIETLEAESEGIQATLKKGKNQREKQERVATLDHHIERHRWHIGKLELMRRSLENGGLEVEDIDNIKDSIEYYVKDNQGDDFMEDEEMYDELGLQDEEEVYGMGHEGDKGSSQETQSVQDDTPETESRSGSIPGKSKQPVEPAAAVGRRPSTQLKSPLPTLATLHNPLSNTTNGSAASTPGMKPASVPPRPEGLKYASAAAAAAEKNALGIAPLPPPQGALPVTASVGISPLPPAAQTAKTSATSSPSTTSIQPAPSDPKPGPVAPLEPKTQEPTPSATPAPISKKADKAAAKAAAKATAAAEAAESSRSSQTNGVSNGVKSTPVEEDKEEDCVYHLPASLSDLVDSFEITKKRALPVNAPSQIRMMQVSQASTPDVGDAEAPRKYKPDQRYPSQAQYPQEPLPIFDDPRLYGRIDPDTLFYVFYYKQGTYQQYLAAKALKDQSWRFHKQYQTWFQRHEEPKSITEEFEQGTYRFFDYESTWMNRRKADFKFAYRFLEDEV
ncbi:Not1 domain-containing protein [Truncatella angustata]|uniref:General negative regulator of transcription subunit n=1 Tax=Truncatella angustata TaxID=152316 RepID=A0A9P8UNN0_9PEZI|nr:Not1 domain-containing protein [Truncatella angustata]KAH6655606.1 Not1 domain-containing protein [Truncatella angustata]